MKVLNDFQTMLIKFNKSDIKALEFVGCRYNIGCNTLYDLYDAVMEQNEDADYDRLHEGFSVDPYKVDKEVLIEIAKGIQEDTENFTTSHPLLSSSLMSKLYDLTHKQCMAL